MVYASPSILFNLLIRLNINLWSHIEDIAHYKIILKDKINKAHGIGDLHRRINIKKQIT